MALGIVSLGQFVLVTKETQFGPNSLGKGPAA